MAASKDTRGVTRDALLAASPDERRGLLESSIQREVARVLQIDPARLDVQRPLSTVGLDSLTGLELKNRLEGELHVTLPMVSLMQDPSISQLATRLLGLLADAPASPSRTRPAGAQPPTPGADGGRPTEELLSTVDRLSDEEVDVMLRQMLRDEDGR